MTKCGCGTPGEGDVMTDCQKQFLMDTEAADKGDEHNHPDNSDSGVQRRMLRCLGEYRRYKDRILRETVTEGRKTPTG